MINALCFVFAFQLVGTFIAQGLLLSVPGPVIGMAMLLVWLLSGLRVPESLDKLTTNFLSYLPLLFVPAAVGVIRYGDVLVDKGGLLLLVILLSTLAGLIVSVMVFSFIAARMSPPNDGERRA